MFNKIVVKPKMAEMPETMKKAVLEKTVPSTWEMRDERQVSSEITGRLSGIAKGLKIAVYGSFARNTHLKNEKDIDVFMLFNGSTGIKKMEKIAISAGKKFFGKSCWLEYSEHPYVKGIYKGHIVEIVPGYNLRTTETLLSAVDRTPFHHRYLKKRLSPKLCNEIRLMKSFLKGIECYGAKVSVSGLSGYLTELLVLKYGSFEKTLKAIAKWSERETIEIEKGDKKHSGRFSHHLVVLDPTDKKRNTAASVSMEQYYRLRKAARAFLNKPTRKFFHVFAEQPDEIKIRKELSKRNFAIVEMPLPVKGIIDIVGAQQ